MVVSDILVNDELHSRMTVYNLDFLFRSMKQSVPQHIMPYL